MVDRTAVPAGWNDPPKLSYTETPGKTSVKSLFNQRVAFPNSPSQQPAVYGAAPLYQSHSDQQVANGGVFYQPTQTANHSGYFTPAPGANGAAQMPLSPGLHHSFSVPNGLLNFPGAHEGDRLIGGQKTGSNPHLADAIVNGDSITTPQMNVEDLPDDVIVDIFMSALEGSKLHVCNRFNSY